MPTREINLDGTPTNVMEVTYEGCPIISEIAKRDEEGNKIHETYAKKTELTEAIAAIPAPTLDTEGVQAIVNSSLQTYNNNLETLLASLGYFKLPQLVNPEEGKQYVLLYTNGSLSWVTLEPVTPPEEEPTTTTVEGVVAIGNDGEIRLTAVTDNGETIGRIVYTYDNE